MRHMIPSVWNTHLGLVGVWLGCREDRLVLDEPQPHDSGWAHLLWGGAEAEGLEAKVPLSSRLHEATTASILKGDLGYHMVTVLAIEYPHDMSEVLRGDVFLLRDEDVRSSVQ